MDQTHDGRAIKILSVIDEFTRECLALVVDRRLRSIESFNGKLRDEKLNGQIFHTLTGGRAITGGLKVKEVYAAGTYWGVFKKALYCLTTDNTLYRYDGF